MAEIDKCFSISSLFFNPLVYSRVLMDPADIDGQQRTEYARELFETSRDVCLNIIETKNAVKMVP